MDGTVYSVNIYDANYSGSIIDLKGGAQPFVTQEDDTEDVFTPIRTQSGYIRIVDDGKDAAGNSFNWRDLIPATATSRPVRLTSTSGGTTTVHWAGFIQPQTFTGHYVDSIQEREFPVCCLLTALSAYDVEPTNASYQYANFAYILGYVFSDVNGFFPNLTFRFHGGDDVDAWLQKKVSWSNFADKDEDGHLTSKYNCCDVVEEVCKFFGWSARAKGMTVYFEQTGSGMTWREIGFIGLQNLGIGTSYSAVTVSPTSYSSYPGSYMSTEQNLMIMRGWRKSVVTAEIDKLSTIIEYPTSEIYKIIVPEWRGGVTRSGGPAWYLYYVNREPIPGLNEFNCEDAVVEFQQGTTTIYGRTVAYRGFPFIWSDYHDATEPEPHDVSMKQGVCLEHAAAQNPDASHYLMRIRTKNAYWLQEGILVVSGKTYTDGGIVDGQPVINNGNGYLLCSLKIGGKYAYIYYDAQQVRHTEWRTAFATFAINTGSDDQEEHDGEGQIVSTRKWGDPYPSYDGYAVPVENAIGGEMEFCIHGFHDANPPAGSSANSRAVQLMDLKLEFFRETAQGDENASNNGKNKYVVSGNTAFTDEKSVDLAFATDNNNSFGRSIVCNADGTYCQSISIGGSNVRPEQRLVNRMAAWGQQTRDMLVLETDGTGGARTLSPLCLVTTGGKTFAPISISHEWRDDKHIVKYVEIDS
jgi:hypothetical protein